MTTNSRKISLLEFVDGVTNRRSFLTILGRFLERCPYSPDGQYNGSKTKVTDLMVGFSYTQYKEYMEIAKKLGLITPEGTRTDDGQCVLNDLYHIGAIFKKNNNSNNGHNRNNSH
jgi:hypothetical protein